jgi:hypothetical protein
MFKVVQMSGRDGEAAGVFQNIPTTAAGLLYHTLLLILYR